ncbi:MAG: adenylate/guanylate cyclase domain-containing protein [Geminicoccaceae bacterium]
MAVDVVGFSALVEHDDLGTALRLRTLRAAILTPLIRGHDGEVFSVAGDGSMSIFSTPGDAVASALNIQQVLDLPGSPVGRLLVRIGISYGSVIGIGSEIYGTPLNVAARLQALAEPGEVIVTGDVVERTRPQDGARFSFLGVRKLHKMTTEVSLFRAEAPPVTTVLAA